GRFRKKGKEDPEKGDPALASNRRVKRILDTLNKHIQPHHISVSPSVTKTCTHWVERWCPITDSCLSCAHQAICLITWSCMKLVMVLLLEIRFLEEKEFYAPGSSKKKPED